MNPATIERRCRHSAGYFVCNECNGTGAEKPDCYLCRGNRSVSVKRALRNGWQRSDLEDIMDDGYCECPECHSSICEQCRGDATVRAGVNSQQETRVLIYGLTKKIPPIRYRDHIGRVREYEALLIKRAGLACRDKGWIFWSCDILGDYVSLTPSGEQEALARLFDWTRKTDTTLAPIDEVGRWGDDGGCAHG